MKKMLLLLLVICGPALAEIKPEPMGIVETLPEKFPPHWIIAADSSFFHMSDGKFIVLDADSDDPATRFKGMMNGSTIPLLYMPQSRSEMYVAETFRTRVHRGERTDVITVYDKATLAPIDEIIIPPKRVSALPTEYYLRTTNDEKFLLVYNFTPAQSVTVIDLDQREFVGEIQIPGCALVYPTGQTGFSSLCADGSFMTVQLDEDGAQASNVKSERFFDAEGDPLIERSAIIDGIAYFPTYLGTMFPVDLTGDAPEIGESWPLADGVEGGWRPGGMTLAKGDSDGRLYVMMHPDGGDGTHDNPGVEVWVFNPKTGERLDRIGLALPAITMGLTRDDQPLLVTTNVNLELDVYDAKSGEHLRTIGNFGQETVFAIHSDQQ